MVKPIYHLQPETGWMNDPNGPVFIDGKLHMFYQHNPFGASWGNMTWGHAVSPDMVFWKRLPHALKPDKDYDKDGVFSGCCVLRKGLPHIIYTGVRPEVVCLAIGNADASEFTKYEGNPILKGGYRYGWRDPYVLPNPNGGYLMLIGAGDNQGGFVEVYKSKDLISWTKDGDLTDCIGLDLHDEMWECPVMAVMQTNSSKIKGKDAVLFVSAVPDITVRAILGTFDGHKLLPLTNAIRMADLGDCVYAPNLVRHPDGRWIMYGWQRECGEEKDRAAQGWQGMLTLPREVSVKDGELLIRPAKEVRNLRGRHALNEEYIVAMYLDFGQHYEVEAMISDGKAEVSFEFLYSPAGSVKLSINEDSLELDKGPYSGGGAKTISRAIARKPKRRLNAFVDGTSLEIFLDRQVALTTRVYPTEESIGFKCFSKATEGITKLDVYKMKDCYAEYENARQNGSKTVRVKHKS